MLINVELPKGKRGPTSKTSWMFVESGLFPQTALTACSGHFYFPARLLRHAIAICNEAWQRMSQQTRVRSLDRGPGCPGCLGIYQDYHGHAQTADMPLSIPTTVSLRRLSKKAGEGGVVDSVEFSNITICIIRVSSDDLRLDTDACRMSLDDSRAPTLQNPPRRRSRTRFMWFR
jgi:hypothetical protein